MVTGSDSQAAARTPPSGPGDVVSPNVCRSSIDSTHAPLATGRNRTTSRCRDGGQAGAVCAAGSIQADSIRPAAGGELRKSGGTARATGRSAATPATAARHRAVPSAPARKERRDSVAACAPVSPADGSAALGTAVIAQHTSDAAATTAGHRDRR